MIPATTAECDSAARRPEHSVLDSSQLRERFGIQLPDWREELALALAPHASPGSGGGVGAATLRSSDRALK
ncbi:MAG: sugar nucleotide-binding protein [Gemmatimonadaceae bacterium]